MVRAPARVKDFPRGAELPVFLLDPPEPLAAVGAMKPRDRIGEFIEELVVEALRQLFDYTRPRSGKLGLTMHGFQKMREYELDVKTLEDAFRWGVEVDV